MRTILREEQFQVSGSEPEDDWLWVKICGPSDSERAEHRYEDIVVLEWRSPFGDDLHVEIPRRELRHLTRAEDVEGT